MKKHILRIDTREQKPLFFDTFGVKVRREKLSCGDYHMVFSDGTSSSVVFERKSIPDLFGTMTKGHERFKKEMTRAKEQGLSMVILVEGPLSQVAKGCKHSRVPGITIIRTVFSLWTRYGLVPIFSRNREEASQYILQFYLAEYRKQQKEVGNG